MFTFFLLYVQVLIICIQPRQSSGGEGDGNGTGTRALRHFRDGEERNALARVEPVPHAVDFPGESGDARVQIDSERRERRLRIIRTERGPEPTTLISSGTR